MGIFYKRKETPEKIEIVYKCNFYYYLLLLLLIVLGVFFNFFVFSMFAIAILTVIYMVDLLKPSREVKRAMKEGKVEMEGSKYSLSNPVKVVIKKQSKS